MGIFYAHLKVISLKEPALILSRIHEILKPGDAHNYEHENKQYVAYFFKHGKEKK